MRFFSSIESKSGVDEPGYEPPRERFPPAPGGEPPRQADPESPEDHSLRNGLIWAVLFPIVGVVLAIRLFARERTGQGFAVLATAVLVVLLIFYGLGAFDKPLSGVGLNVHECARNGLGQTFCGKELDEARARSKRFEQEAAAAKTNAEEQERALERKGREEEAKLREESRAQERQAQEELAKLNRESNEQQSQTEAEIERATEG